MRSVLAWSTALAAIVCLSGCDGLVVVISTGPSSLPPAGAVAGGRVDGGLIVTGHPISGAITTPGGGVDFRFVAPRSGTLVLGVNWDRSLGTMDVLFASNVLPRSGSAPPFTVRLPVLAGQTYTIQVNDGMVRTGAMLNLPFTLDAAME